MSKLFAHDHAPTVAQAHRVSILRLTPHAELAPIRARLVESQAEVSAAQAAKQAVEDAIIATNAQIDYEDALLDRRVIDCARDKRGQIGGAKPDTTTTFRDIFIVAPSTAMDGAPDVEQDHYVTLVLAGLERPENAALKDRHGRGIAEQHARLQAAMAERARLEGELAQKDAALERAVAKARRVFNEAQLDAASLTKDQDLAASLFDFRPPRTRKKAAPAPTEA